MRRGRQVELLPDINGPGILDIVPFGQIPLVDALALRNTVERVTLFYDVHVGLLRRSLGRRARFTPLHHAVIHYWRMMMGSGLAADNQEA